jgi:hypothetical protein
MATPLEISIALWYRCRVGDYGKGTGDCNYTAPAVKETFKRFVDAGLLGLSPAGSDAVYYGTDALGVYVDALCDVPWPVQKWVIPDKEECTSS